MGVCVCLAGHLTLFRFNDAASRTGRRRCRLRPLSLGSFPCSRTFADDVCQRIVRCKLLVPLSPSLSFSHCCCCLRLTNAVTGNHYIHLVATPAAPPAPAPSSCVTSCVHKLQAASTASVYKTREGCDCCCCCGCC